MKNNEEKHPLRCILLIDDDLATNFLHQDVIKSTGVKAHIQVCHDGQEALDYLNCEGEFSNEPFFPQPGIIFLDINMPGMNGWEFLEVYEKMPSDRKAEIVVAMLTTSLNLDDHDKAEKTEGVKKYLSKPLKKEYLEELIEKNFKSF
ncbi:response regulator [Marivirga lumbricoides]|uniref:Response regulator n=1 Tax=Marivirga lumbricoides TaxID=1046115 RepID=A0ABQ1N6P9_9BACT|nr:response regulator [Marivirga lumbricoides]